MNTFGTIMMICGIIFTPLYFIKTSKFKEMSRYVEFLENEYVNFITLLSNSNNKEREELLNKAQKTSLYKYIKVRYSNNPNLEMFRQNHYDSDYTDKNPKDRT